MRVLIVHDDEREGRELAASMATLEHHVVGVARSTEQAMSLLATAKPELVLVRVADEADPADLGELLDAVGKDHGGGRPRLGTTGRSGTYQLGTSQLSAREQEVFGLLVQGFRIADISGRLFISPHTVRKHTKAIFRKLGVHSQIELMREHGGDQRHRRR